MKKFEILQELSKCGALDMKWANAVGTADRLISAGFPEAFDLREKQFNCDMLYNEVCLYRKVQGTQPSEI